MIKICGVVVMFLGSFAFTETSYLWFVQAVLIGIFLFFSEGLFEVVTKVHALNSVDLVKIKNAQPKYGWVTFE